ncbi:hypothetical protein CCHOA_06465 [Corynebacterium choanae]|uniref:Uncharacterized protein n=1 Tax=Corynebacterium choanae TaxID=1862358 RepID=A0A3G6J7A0_9CORY|nr:hypothetical protein CCHOA_06465 [Corynebacterium choanae]
MVVVLGAVTGQAIAAPMKTTLGASFEPWCRLYITPRTSSVSAAGSWSEVFWQPSGLFVGCVTVRLVFRCVFRGRILGRHQFLQAGHNRRECADE